MRKFILLASAMAFALISYASENDSIQSPVELQEVVIQAPKIVRKADMDVLYPSASAIENSKSDLTFRSITTCNGDVRNVASANSSTPIRRKTAHPLPEDNGIKAIGWLK